MDTEPHSATHGDPVHVCDVGLRVSRDEVVKSIFRAEVICETWVVWVGEDGLDDRRNIPASAKGLFASTGNNNDVGKLGVFPFLPGE